MNRKILLGGIIALGLVLVFLVSGCAFPQSLVGERYKTSVLTIEGKRIEVKLPKELPSMESVVYSYERCFNAAVCMQRFCLSEEPNHDHVDFIYTSNDVIGLVWLKTVEGEYVVWIYVERIPVSATIDEMIQLIISKEKEEKTTLFLELGNDLAELHKHVLELYGLALTD